MTSVVQFAPQFENEDAIRICREHYGLAVSATPLPSERDQNFKVWTQDGAAYVLKIANTLEDPDILDFQNRAMDHLYRYRHGKGEAGQISPKICTALDGNEIIAVSAPEGTPHLVRLVTYLAGKPFALVKPHNPELMRSLGRLFAEVDRIFADFNHAAAQRYFHWDLQHGDKLVTELVTHIEDAEQQDLVLRFLAHYRQTVMPLLAELRCSIIHNDGNDYNVLVSPDGRWQQRVSGVIDFGDMVYSQTINELAVACAYAMLDKADPIAAAAQVARGYHETWPLTETELSMLFGLAVMRLCLSVCHAAHQASLEPDNEYLRISEKPAWSLLQKLDQVHPRLAHYRFRQACGLTPVPHGGRVARWLKHRSQDFASVMGDELRTGRPAVIDLSIDSPLMTSPDDIERMDAFNAKLFGHLDTIGAAIGIGRYNEARLWYTAAQYRIETDEAPENRTVHLGIDLHAEAGRPVTAFWEGTVHSFQVNALPLDYGPTIVLAHETDDGDRFYTLYGHLSRESLTGLKIGQKISKGDVFAHLGDMDVNGGWPPHLHLQIILDMLGKSGDFFGVAAPSQRDLWTAVCPDPNLILGIAADCFPKAQKTPDELLQFRQRHMNRNLSISYDAPLKIVRGMGAHLFDADGRAYLDGVNNVCHVGHCHPRVVAAGAKQMAVLNTNTRYLHDNIIAYAQRLLATFPEPLSVCTFVCTGSEANELALRMARTYTGRQGIITVDGAYHGNTQALIDISPYKHDGPGGSGAPAWVRSVTMPDGYRGPYRGTGSEVGAQYAEFVRQAMDGDADQRPAAFICESMLGCGGQVILPEGYLKNAFAHVRDFGGVCIADEVQVGFGRAGTHFWAFESQAVVPDIVTLGKPMGNGHPLAAVITTPAIAEAFYNGMEYFNTFGGNPVSCAIGMAVMDVIEDEALQENARQVGDYLLSELKRLMQKYPLIGDVRGLGLYLGAELVTDRSSLAPATDQADYIANRVKDYGVLISTDGPMYNVLKLKPPIVWSPADAEQLVDALDRILAEDCLQV